MNNLNFYRKPHLSIFFAYLILFVSCDQNNIYEDEQAFDYSVYNEFSTDNKIFTTSNINNSRNVSQARAELDAINNEYGTNILFSDEFLSLPNNSSESIELIALRNGWLKSHDIHLIDKFETDLNNSDFDSALRNYENNVLGLNLTNAEFKEKNLIANAFRALYDNNPALFTNSNYQRGWGCFRAAAALTISSVALASCATVIACGLAVSAWILSYSAYSDNC